MSENNIKKVEVDVVKFIELLKSFKLYYEGFTHHHKFALEEITRFYRKLEIIIFGESIIRSWS